MIWFFLGLAVWATVELMHRVPVLERVRVATSTTTRSGKLIANKLVSDHWKEIVLPRYSLRIATSSLAAFGYLLLAFAPIIVLTALGPLFGVDVLGILLGWQAIVGITVGAIAYSYVRNKVFGGGGSSSAGSQTDASQYSPLARMTHRVALSAPSRGEMLFDLEHALAKPPKPEAADGRHVFVTGLARAGTTVLMRAIHGSGAFASLTYRDMPFVMAPSLWARLSGGSRRQMEKTERAHGDGVLVDFDSPEALEEPFWRTFCGSDYIEAGKLVPHDVDQETVENYRKFVGHVLSHKDAGRYLAKNNNNILRLQALRKAFPEAVILLPFRTPADQAQSLYVQHRRFSDEEDRFTRDYMGWLAHHEFGADHRPFVFNGQRPDGSPDEADYWLSEWLTVHRHLLAAVEQNDPDGRLLPVAYEDFCAEDRSLWHALCQQLLIDPGAPDFRVMAVDKQATFDPALLKQADELYSHLRTVTRARLPDWTG